MLSAVLGEKLLLSGPGVQEMGSPASFSGATPPQEEGHSRPAHSGTGQTGSSVSMGKRLLQNEEGKVATSGYFRSSQGKYSSLHRNHCQCPENVSFQSRQFTF